MTDTVPTPSFTDLANLRHAYSHLAAGRVKDQKQFADGLIAPVIRSLERSIDAAQAAPKSALCADCIACGCKKDCTPQPASNAYKP